MLLRKNDHGCVIISQEWVFQRHCPRFTTLFPINNSNDKSSSWSILVLGAGELGMAVIRNLSKKSSSHVTVSPITTISVLLRSASIESKDPNKQQEIAELRQLGVTLVAGDLVASSTKELAEIFRPFHTVIGCTGFVAGRSVQLKVARAALDAGIKRYFPWQFGVDYDVIGRGSAQDLFDEQLDVRDLLRSQKQTDWVIVSTGMFTSFLFDPSFGVVDLLAPSGSPTVHALGSFDNSVTVTTAEDIGALTAEIVLHHDGKIANEIVYTAGDTVTYSQLADVVESVLNRKVLRETWSVQKLKEDLTAEPTNALKKYRVVFAQGRGVSWAVEKTFNARRRIAVTDVKGWAQKNLRS